MREQSVVALGGGHGLHASLSALRLLDCTITAVVTVADDGGSSGRIRRELPVLPPGDLRMALAALAEGSLPSLHSPAKTANSASATDDPADHIEWSELLQHRIGGHGALAGHPIGNLLLTGMLEMSADPVWALDRLAAMVGARGRVLPMAEVPLDLSAQVTSFDPDDPERRRTIRGQASIAVTPGRVESIELIPPDPPACAAAVEAIRAAHTVVLGPGSWFTSVMPHLLVPQLADAICETTAHVVVVLNLEPQVGETDDFSPVDHLRVLSEHCPSLHVDAVVADSGQVTDERALAEYVSSVGARLVLTPVAVDGSRARHDPAKLSDALVAATGLTRGAPESAPAEQLGSGTTQRQAHAGTGNSPAEQGVRTWR